MTKEEQEVDWCRRMLRALAIPVADGDGGLQHTRGRPDCTFRLANGKLVAVEVTRAMNERIAAGNGARRILQSEIEKQLRATGLNVSINLSISDGGATGLMDLRDARQRAIRRIADLATELAGDPGFVADGLWRCFSRTAPYPRPRRIDDPRRLGKLGIDFIDSVMIRAYEQPMVSADGGAGGMQGPDVIERAIKEKEAKLAAYRASVRADEHWLLVVGSAGRGGAFDASVADRNFTSAFDRTAFLECWAEKCVFLKTRAATSGDTRLSG